MANGETRKLAKAIERDGVKNYFCNGVLHISGAVAKDKRSRQTQIPPNVVQWLERYPPTPAAICPGDWLAYAEIRKRFKIPHDGLRQTAISAHVSLHGSFADAASQFGNSETMIRTHYFNRMTKEEAARSTRLCPRHPFLSRKRPQGSKRPDLAPLAIRTSSRAFALPPCCT